ncbi:hypothetical protein L1987_84869 [Smallanthus sonchifolius]|uniref:Uncharacterized protein n=1 Tax=Smallanthus sonchifolius TaxID=185202 RepID=A0ACB8XVH8_9ASTR|nr:hypothetical protein L1987_84869 [Smallanthus sonchifolius]
MEIQLMTLSPATTTTAPYATAPSTPPRFPNFFYSAPTSPIHTTFQDADADEDNDFSFDFSGQLEPPSISAADDLFHGGKIKTANPSSNHHPQPPTSRCREGKESSLLVLVESFSSCAAFINHSLPVCSHQVSRIEIVSISG